MSEMVEQVAAVLLEHARFGPWECACGGCHLYDGDRSVRARKLAAHQAEALATAGLVVTGTEMRSLDDGFAWATTDAQGRTTSGGRPQTRQQRGVTEWRDA